MENHTKYPQHVQETHVNTAKNANSQHTQNTEKKQDSNTTNYTQQTMEEQEHATGVQNHSFQQEGNGTAVQHAGNTPVWNKTTNTKKNTGHDMVKLKNKTTLIT